MSMYGTFLDITAVLDTIDEEEELDPYKEEEEENLVTAALFTAIEEGDIEGITELLDQTSKYDINTRNRHGEGPIHLAACTGQLEILKLLESRGADIEAHDKHGDCAVSWAARQGHCDVIAYLREHGVPLNTQNRSGETAIHVAARYGHTTVISYLCTADINLNLQDKLGETVLHTVVWHGLGATVCSQLTQAGCKLNSTNKEGETPLHCAAARGNQECVRALLEAGALINLIDRRGFTPLHLACRRCHTGIALTLLHAGCQFDILDQYAETPLHSACREGLLPVVQTLCAFGCRLDIVSKAGVTPLHLAARAGHVEVVRCLLLSGAEPDMPNKDGVTAEIMALAQGHSDIAELLIKLKPERREVFMRQLMPTNTPLDRINLKVVGSSGSGKTTLIDSLKCGYFGSFFRKARLSQSEHKTAVDAPGKSRISRSTTVLGNYDLHTGTYNGVHINGNGSNLTKHNSLPSQLSYEVSNENYTRGIDVTHLTMAQVGQLTAWDFSGYEPYYMLYDRFLGDPRCLHMIVFSLEEPQSAQLAQLTFWLNFLRAHIAPHTPIGPGGRPLCPARVVLVATHADVANCSKDLAGEFVCPEAAELASMVREKFRAEFEIWEHVFVVDAHLAMSADLKILRNHIAHVKSTLLKTLPTSNGFLDAVLAMLPAWRKTAAPFPVLPWPAFLQYVRQHVNTLASNEHTRALVSHLQLMGEIVYVGAASVGGGDGLVVLCPHWLCNDILGDLFSRERLATIRPTGCLTMYDFEIMFPETDAVSLLPLLEALSLCTRCELDEDEIEYEVPALNFVETLHGLWEKDVTRYEDAVYSGVRLQCPRNVPNQIIHVFPRIQVELRRSMIAEVTGGGDADLYQWHHGSKYVCGLLECLITVECGEQAIEVKVRGPPDARATLYYFLEELVGVVEGTMDEACPGVQLERHLLSPRHLADHEPSPHAYAPHTILEAQLAGKEELQLEDDVTESMYALLCCGSEELQPCMTLGVNLHVSHLDIHSRTRLSLLLDPSDPMGRDWCLLAVSLGLQEDVPVLDDARRQAESRMDRTLEQWAATTPEATIALLIDKLTELGRQDAIDCLLNTAPLARLFHPEPTVEDPSNPSPNNCHSSNNTLSSVSR